MVRYMLPISVFLLLGAATVIASNVTTQTVTFQIDAINEISVSGNPGNLVINSATAGSQPNSATDNTTTYSITTNESGKKLTGKIDSAMPTNTTLEINLAAPTGGSSQGDVTLTTTDSDLVTSISQVAQSGLTITYTFSATVSAGTLSSTQRTVTLTLTDS
ncbi:MAG: hypothetical protein ACUVUU_07360 [bacterium]